MRYAETTHCRSCRLPAEKFIPVLSLGPLYVSNFVEAPSEACHQAPLELVLCDVAQEGCGLVQLKHTTPPQWMYQQYWYRSGMNEGMRKALAEICGQAEGFVRPSAGEIVLDIGCNDGTLLRSYRTGGLIRVGFEPAANLVPEASAGTDRILPNYFNSGDFEKAFPGRKAKIITSVAMFYDLEDPNHFTADIVRCLDENGVWIIQMSYLPLMLERNAFDNVCHEHLQYYALLPLRRLLQAHGLRVADVELNEVNGGSFRILICHEKEKGLRFPGGEHRVRAMEESERALGLCSPAVYREFAARVENIKDRLVGFIREEDRRGRKIYVYGASTKGNTLLQYFGLNYPLVGAAAERSPEKWGKKTVGTWIPIVSEEQARKDRPDYLLVLPWHFLGEFLQREEEYLQSGGAFIIPLPEPQLITREGRRPL